MSQKIEKYSPDKKHKLIFFDSVEPRMGMNMCKFSLVELQSNTETNFEPLLAIGYSGNSASWSENSNYFLLPVGSPSDLFFVYDIANRQFASIHFNNVWVLKSQIIQDRIEVEFEDSQIPERIEHNKYPTRSFSKPPIQTFKLSQLKWIDIKNLQQFEELTLNSAIIELKPTDNGWRQFKGKLPETTEVLVWELNQFANYGDKQSQEWFEEIKSKTTDINYWVNATNYLGLKKRK